MKNYCVVTTVHPPTKAIEILYEKFGENLIIIGDKKTPENWEYKGITPSITLHNPIYAPDNHYARKNLGYLESIKNGAKLIYDTDDDNIPNKKWKIRGREAKSESTYDYEGWYNVYHIFGMDRIWPRGFSLKEINKLPRKTPWVVNINSSIQQGISDGEPDVDAIHRLIFGTEVKFADNGSINLGYGTWCPFNSQSTWWFPKAYPLMYLPVYAPFRMTDIWRSFVAQRCLWELGEGVTFHSPAEVFQDRNEHNLMKDFEDEILGYLKNDLIVEILGKLKLKRGEYSVCDNLLTCYRALVENDILPYGEIDSVKAWINDYRIITNE